MANSQRQLRRSTKILVAVALALGTLSGLNAYASNERTKDYETVDQCETFNSYYTYAVDGTKTYHRSRVNDEGECAVPGLLPSPAPVVR